MRKAKTLARLIASCETEARANGFAGEGWEPTAFDLDWVTDQLGRKPSREEWAEAGYPHVGGRHAGRPSLAGGGRSPRLAVSLSPTLQAHAERVAESLGISLAELVRRLLASARSKA